jgi:hypothetical protein
MVGHQRGVEVTWVLTRPGAVAERAARTKGSQHEAKPIFVDSATALIDERELLTRAMILVPH